MKKQILSRLAVSLLGAFACAVPTKAFAAETTTTSNKTPVPVILDADMSTDVDDLIAAKILMGYDAEGLIDLKAVMMSVNNSKSMAQKAASGLLDAYGFPDVAVGYSQDIIEDRDILPYWGYLSSLDQGTNPTDTAVRQYRKILSACAPDEKVVIVVTGHRNNIYKKHIEQSGAVDLPTASFSLRKRKEHRQNSE